MSFFRRSRRWIKPNFGGLAAGLVFYCFALTPSLLPTPSWLLGITAGLSFAIGYGFGVAASWVWRGTVKREVSGRAKRYAWIMLAIVLSVTAVAYAVWTASWQNEVRRLVGETAFMGQDVVVVVGLAVVTAAVLIVIARGVRAAAGVIGRFAGRWVPARISTAVGVVTVALLIVFLYNGVLVRVFVVVSHNISRASNSRTDPGVTRPKSSVRSGGPDSLVAWETLGREGRNFVAGGPSRQELTEFNEKQADNPIRVYAGFDSAGTVVERAELAVRELERTGAFEREVLAVMTATGTGWIEPQSADSLEYVWNGDSALVSVQYSYLPSWISFLVDRQRASTAGRELFNAVYDKWSKLPPDDRPKLFAYGLSLGSFGAQAAFSGTDDLQNRTDGALFMGTPSFSQPWRQFTDGRDAGSPEWQPMYEGGRAVRFAAKAGDLKKPDTSWQKPRVVYMQHASDPVVWWNFDVLLSKPDWLKEPRGPDVSPDVQWYPFVTFAQLTLNQLSATTVPNGHGHNYGDSTVGAWTALATPPDWATEKSEVLQRMIDEYPRRNPLDFIQ